MRPAGESNARLHQNGSHPILVGAPGSPSGFVVSSGYQMPSGSLPPTQVASGWHAPNMGIPRNAMGAPYHVTSPPRSGFPSLPSPAAIAAAAVNATSPPALRSLQAIANMNSQPMLSPSFVQTNLTMPPNKLSSPGRSAQPPHSPIQGPPGSGLAGPNNTPSIRPNAPTSPLRGPPAAPSMSSSPLRGPPARTPSGGSFPSPTAVGVATPNALRPMEVGGSTMSSFNDAALRNVNAVLDLVASHPQPAPLGPTFVPVAAPLLTASREIDSSLERPVAVFNHHTTFQPLSISSTIDGMYMGAPLPQSAPLDTYSLPGTLASNHCGSGVNSSPGPQAQPPRSPLVPPVRTMSVTSAAALEASSAAAASTTRASARQVDPVPSPSENGSRRSESASQPASSRSRRSARSSRKGPSATSVHSDATNPPLVLAGAPRPAGSYDHVAMGPDRHTRAMQPGRVSDSGSVRSEAVVMSSAASSTRRGEPRGSHASLPNARQAGSHAHSAIAAAGLVVGPPRPSTTYTPAASHARSHQTRSDVASSQGYCMPTSEERYSEAHWRTGGARHHYSESPARGASSASDSGSEQDEFDRRESLGRFRSPESSDRTKRPDRPTAADATRRPTDSPLCPRDLSSPSSDDPTDSASAPPVPVPPRGVRAAYMAELAAVSALGEDIREAQEARADARRVAAGAMQVANEVATALERIMSAGSLRAIPTDVDEPRRKRSGAAERSPPSVRRRSRRAAAGHIVSSDDDAAGVLSYSGAYTGEVDIALPEGVSPRRRIGASMGPSSPAAASAPTATIGTSGATATRTAADDGVAGAHARSPRHPEPPGTPTRPGGVPPMVGSADGALGDYGAVRTATAMDGLRGYVGYPPTGRSEFATETDSSVVPSSQVSVERVPRRRVAPGMPSEVTAFTRDSNRRHHDRPDGASRSTAQSSQRRGHELPRPERPLPLPTSREGAQTPGVVLGDHAVGASSTRRAADGDTAAVPKERRRKGTKRDVDDGASSPSRARRGDDRSPVAADGVTLKSRKSRRSSRTHGSSVHDASRMGGPAAGAGRSPFAYQGVGVTTHDPDLFGVSLCESPGRVPMTLQASPPHYSSPYPTSPGMTAGAPYLHGYPTPCLPVKVYEPSTQIGVHEGVHPLSHLHQGRVVHDGPPPPVTVHEYWDVGTPTSWDARVGCPSFPCYATGSVVRAMSPQRLRSQSPAASPPRKVKRKKSKKQTVDILPSPNSLRADSNAHFVGVHGPSTILYPFVYGHPNHGSAVLPGPSAVCR